MSESNLQVMDEDWFDIVRRSDGYVAFSLPAAGRHLVYRTNGIFSMRPLLEDEEIFTPNSFMQFLSSLGYHITPPPDILSSTA